MAGLRAVQVDAVNVLIRSHYLPLFSRLGSYPVHLLDDLAYRRRELFEYAGHALSLLTIDHHPLLRWRMARHRTQRSDAWREAIEAKRPGYVDAVVAEIRERGPLAFTDLSDPGRHDRVQTKYADPSIAWWRWSHGKDVLTELAAVGELAVAGRKPSFEARYDLAERVIPAEVLAAPTPGETDAQRELVRRAVGALGVGTAREVADYYRLPVVTTKARLAELIATSAVVPARVESWKDPAFAAPEASTRAVDARALVSPFDSLVWERRRAERVFGFKVSFEIYVPAPKRVYGYFVLPFLLGDALVARVDVKADRERGVLLVPGVFLEPAQRKSKADVVAGLAIELRALAAWLGLGSVEVGAGGDLASPLRRVFRR
jgi:uncharacterized protein YcaQ